LRRRPRRIYDCRHGRLRMLFGSSATTRLERIEPADGQAFGYWTDCSATNFVTVLPRTGRETFATRFGMTSITKT
jgi:hypothetical protein